MVFVTTPAGQAADNNRDRRKPSFSPPCTLSVTQPTINCCSHIINSHDQVRGHRSGSSHSGAEEYPRGNTNNPRWYTHISQLTYFMPPSETYKSEIGSQSTMCQVHTGEYVSFLTPGETDLTACRPRKTTTYTITRSIYHYAYARQT